MKKTLLFFCLVSLFFAKTFAQNSLGSPVIINEVRALSGSQFIELYNEGGALGQSLGCYTLIIWKQTNSNSDFYVFNFNDNMAFNGSNRFLELNSSFLQSNTEYNLYTYDSVNDEYIISRPSPFPIDLLHTGNIENAVFLFRKSGALADAIITKDNLSGALALVNGFNKNIFGISTCNSSEINVYWGEVASQLSSRNIGPAINGGVAERVNDGSCFGWDKDAGKGSGTPGDTNGPVLKSQEGQVFSSPVFDFFNISYENTPNNIINVYSGSQTVGSVAEGAVAFNSSYDSVTVNVLIQNLNPINLSYNIRIWSDNLNAGFFDPEDDILDTVYTFTPGSTTYSKTITIPNYVNGRYVFVELTTTPGTCYRSQVRTLTGVAALPVLLKNYIVKFVNGNNKVIWTTSTEQNNKGFEVQKSVGSTQDFRTIGVVGTRAKDGNSNTEISYSFEDADIKAGAMHYYRLKQVDFDGKFTYSAIKSIKPGSIESNLSVYPNPSQGSFTLTTGAASGKVNVFLLDNTGRVINQYINVSSSNTKFNNLKKGFYTLKIVDVETGEQSAQRVVVQ